ncbi:MAG: hypothetical protein FJ109_16825, partial [Deltaproteobacteria bacterium]|nr:hypothetical protein [Deltaproteobacteria bacterium]
LECDSGKRGRVDFSNLVMTVGEEAAAMPSLVLASGAVLGDSPLFNYLVRQGPTGIRGAASLLAPAGAALFVPGLEEFSIPFRGFLEYLPDLEAEGVRFRVRNLACAGKDPACNLLASHSDELFRVGEVMVGVIPLTSADVGKVVHPENVRGLEFADPVAVAVSETERLRKEGADLVVLLVDMEAGGVPGSRTLELLGRDAGADLIIAGGLVRPSTGEPLLISARGGKEGGTVLVASPRAPGAIGRGTLSLKRKGGRWVIERAEPEVRRVSPFRRLDSAAGTLSRLVSEFCSLGQRTLRRGKIDPRMGRSDFVQYVMEILRRKTRADVALLSLDSVRLEESVRIGGDVTSGLLFRTFSMHEVVVLDVAGDELAAYVGWYLDPAAPDRRAELFLLGASRDVDGTIRINDRPLNPKLRYEIATTDFIASGGRGFGQPLISSIRTDRTSTGYFLEEVVTEHFDRADRPAEKIALATDFTPLWERPMWEGSTSATGSFSNISIQNPSAYDQAQLSRSTFNGFKGEGQLWLTMSTRDHKVSDFTKAQYGMARTGDADLLETQDLAIQELTYSWTCLRNLYGKERFYVPAPVVRGRLESEFSQAEGADYHHLEGTGTAGLEWLFGTKASAGVTYGLRRELMKDDDTLHAGINVFYQVNSLPLVTFNPWSAITLDSRFELFYSDWTSTNTLKGIGSTKLSATLMSNLAVTLGVDLFLFREGEGGLAWSLDSTAGLTVGWDTALQQF